MEYPKITIITPSYNQGGYIEETITSILDQKYPNLEYIIIDGGSTDNTVDIIKSYEDQITYWVSESDRGQSHAINKGLEIATGDLVNWINSDDYLEKDALWNLAKAFKDNPDGEVFCGYTHCFWDESGDTSHTYRMGVQPTATATILNIEMNQPGTFFKKPILDSIGSINESLRYVFDNELWMRFLCKYGQNNIVLLDSLFAHFRQHDQSKSIGEGFEEFGKEQQNIIQWLNKQTDLVDFLQDKINEKTVNSNYKSEPWDFSYLDVEYLHAFSADKYMVTLLNEGQKKQAKYCLQKSMKNKIFKLNKKNLGLMKQLFIG